MKYNMCWDITARCNDNCKFCYRNKVKKDLSVEQNKKILKNIYNSKIINKITICGGEPLIYEGLFDLVEGVEKPDDIKLSIVTNGIQLTKYNKVDKKFIINEDILNKVIKYFKWICFSLDSSNQDIETLVTRNNLHVERIKAILHYLNEKNFNVNIKINTLVSKQNYKEIPNVYNLISKYEFVKRWKLFRYLGKDKYFQIDDVNFKKVKEFADNIQNNNISININDLDTYDGTYIMLKQDGTVEVSCDGKLKQVLDLKVDDIKEIENIKEFDKEKHEITHGIKF